ncbi:MAG TPA: hypothetical protein VG754_02165 [Verrucomicrobiae bacterium]|jgi:hypothetical protein|nr:hypothetical protein [Verrucomicrobiae bacterium]
MSQPLKNTGEYELGWAGRIANSWITVVIYLWCVLLMWLFVTGCSRKPTAPPTPSATNAWSWEPYPAAEKMRLATLPCQVLPRTSLTISAPVSGQLRLYVDRAQTNLPAGFLWAEFEPKALNLEAAELAEARRRIVEREKLFEKIELPKEVIKLNKDISAMKKQVMLLEMLSTNAELARAAINAAGLDRDGALKAGSLEDARKELALMEDNLKFLAGTNSAVIGFDIEGARMELERRQLDFDRRRAQSRFTMPFAGQWISSLQLADGVMEYPVSAGQELAVVRDLHSILLRVPLEDVSWSGLPTDKLSAVVPLADGTHLEAAFAFKKLEKFQLREEVFYYFQFPFEDSAAAALLVGTSPTCDLWLELSQPARIVPKLALVLHQPDAFQNRRWNEGLSQLFPGSQLLVEGQTELAILPPVNEISSNLQRSKLTRADPP